MCAADLCGGTQMYLTEERDRILTERARASRASKAELIRQALDVALGIDSGAQQAPARGDQVHRGDPRRRPRLAGVAGSRPRPQRRQAADRAGHISRLFDTTVLIAHLRGNGRATALLLEDADEGPLASVLSRAEIEGGMRSQERADVGAVRQPAASASDRHRGAHRGSHLRRVRRRCVPTPPRRLQLSFGCKGKRDPNHRLCPSDPHLSSGSGGKVPTCPAVRPHAQTRSQPC
ncbi:MAG: ribbon-helix-helix protein, CopG family [Egibacteraceae bacterium]